MEVIFLAFGAVEPEGHVAATPPAAGALVRSLLAELEREILLLDERRQLGAARVEVQVAALVVEPEHLAAAGVAEPAVVLGGRGLVEKLELDALVKRVHQPGSCELGAARVEVEVARRACARVPDAGAVVLLAAVALEPIHVAGRLRLLQLVQVDGREEDLGSIARGENSHDFVWYYRLPA